MNKPNFRKPVYTRHMSPPCKVCIDHETFDFRAESTTYLVWLFGAIVDLPASLTQPTVLLWYLGIDVSAITRLMGGSIAAVAN